MDLLATFAENPLRPAVWPTAAPAPAAAPRRPDRAGSRQQAASSRSAMTAPASPSTARGRATRSCSSPHALADRPVTNAEWLGFIEDGGYADPAALAVRRLGLGAARSGSRRRFTGSTARTAGHRFGLDGLRPLDPAEPVCHISYYEADAFARWAGARLPTEAEWEAPPRRDDPASGNQLDAAGPVGRAAAEAGLGLFGDVWEWTGERLPSLSGLQPAEGAVGEYNGKFMGSQMVLRGGSCATPRGHVRASYRNFFYPHQRWMFAGLRLARDF